MSTILFIEFTVIRYQDNWSLVKYVVHLDCLVGMLLSYFQMSHYYWSLIESISRYSNLVLRNGEGTEGVGLRGPQMGIKLCMPPGSAKTSENGNKKEGEATIDCLLQILEQEWRLELKNRRQSKISYIISWLS